MERLSSATRDLIQGTITEIDDEIERLTRLRTALANVGGERSPRRRRRRAVVTARPTTAKASARSAGPAAIEEVAHVLARAGRTTQAQITKETHLNSGTVSHALKALTAEQPPRAKKTGRRVRNSAEFAWQGEVPVALREAS